MISLTSIPSLAAGLLVIASFCSLVFFYLLRHHFIVHWKRRPNYDASLQLYLQDLRLMRKTLVFSIRSSSVLLSLIVLHFCGTWEVPLPILWGSSALLLLVAAVRALQNHNRIYTPKP